MRCNSGIRKPIGLVMAAILLGLMGYLAFGQAVTGSLVGTVTDSTEAVIPGAKVTITEVNTGFQRQGVANQSGNYAFGNLPPGIYRVEVEVPGFKKGVRDGVEVLVNSTARANLQLEPGEITQSIEVVDETPMLQTDRADVGRKIETQVIADMPLQMNRNFQGLLNLVPGASRTYRPHSEFFNPQDSLSTRVNGQSRLANNVQFEGIDNNHRTGLLTALIPPIEALQTVDITTSNYDAELGRAGGAVVNITLKSGTNEFHGSAFEFNRVSRLAAIRPFATTKAPTTFNQFGFTLGGPIARNRTFFFGDYQGIRDRRGDVTRATIPTMDFRQGDFSAAPTTIFDPATGNSDGSGRSPFPGNRIPASRISPIAQRLLALVPPPTAPGFSTNFERATVRKKDTESFDVKIDHQASQNGTLMFRYSFQRPKTFDPSLYPKAGGPKNSGFAGEGTQKAYNSAINYTYVFSPSLVTELRFGVMRYRNDARNEDYGTKASEAIGIRGVNLDDYTSGLVNIDISGYSNPLVGFAASLPWIRAETNFNLVSNWTKLVANHTVKFGLDARRNRDDLLQTQTFGPRGRFDFREGQTALRGGPKTSFANAFASFLLDVPNTYGRDLAGIFPTFRQTQIFTYVQDKWQATRRLTIDLGIRFEYWGPPTTAQRAGFSNYNPDNNTLELAGVGRIPWNAGIKTDWRNFAPRLGLAYRLSDKMVVRAGYGITVDPSYPDDKWAFNFPVKQNNSFNPLNSYVPAGSMAAGFPPPVLFQIPSSGVIENAETAQVYLTIPKNLRQGYVQSWNFTVQRALPGRFTFEAGYVANHAVGTLYQLNLNAGQVPGAGAAGQPLNQRFGRRADTNTWTALSANYHSLQVKLDRRFANGFMLTTAYTYGKAINYADDNGGIYIDSQWWRDRGPAGFDRKHTWVQSFIYQLPFGPNHRWARSGPARWLFGDWQINGIFSMYSGTPLNITTSAASLNAPGQGNRPDVNGTPKIFHEVGPGKLWFDISKFSAPPPAAFGNVGRNVLRGPGLVNLDFSLFRKVPVTERFNLELRVESFNLTNTPHFSNPNGSFTSASFGQVLSAEPDQRQFQFGLKLIF